MKSAAACSHLDLRLTTLLIIRAVCAHSHSRHSWGPQGARLRGRPYWAVPLRGGGQRPILRYPWREYLHAGWQWYQPVPRQDGDFQRGCPVGAPVRRQRGLRQLYEQRRDRLPGRRLGGERVHRELLPGRWWRVTGRTAPALRPISPLRRPPPHPHRAPSTRASAASPSRRRVMTTLL